MVCTYHSIIGYPVSHYVTNIENELQPNFVPRVFSFSNMMAAGEKTLAHAQQKSSNWFVHGEWKFIQNGGQDKEWEDLGTKTWNWWKTKKKKAAKENSMCSGLSRKILIICKKARANHKNTVERYSDLILCSLTIIICLKPKSFSAHGTFCLISGY